MYTAPDSRPSTVINPTDAEVNFVCLSYRHDFGLMSEDDANTLRREARDWLRAWMSLIERDLSTRKTK